MRTFALLFCLLLVNAFTHAQADILLIDRPAFKECESEAFIALLIARNGMHLKDTRQSLLALKSNGEFQISTINELFDEIERTGTKDHGGFAAKKFYQCSKREGLGVPENASVAAICLARHDIPFYTTADRSKGIPQAKALERILRYLSKSSKEVYPDSLIEQIVPMVYRASSPDDDFALRQFIFETCLFPEDWKARHPISPAAQDKPTAKVEAEAMAPEQMYSKLSPSVWRVFSFNAQGAPIGQGSAVVVARETLVTNCHVLKNAKGLTVKQDNQSFDAIIQHVDWERDICQITARNLPSPPVSIGDSDQLKVGQKIFTLGSPKGLELTLSDGLISALRKDAAMQLLYIQISAPISHGSSGGGLFDKEGRLIGITSAGIVDGQNLNLAIPVNWLRELVVRSDAALAKYKEEKNKQNAATSGLQKAPTSPIQTTQQPEAAQVPERLNSGIPLPPAPSGFARLSDVEALDQFGVRKGYEEFLSHPLPRAFAFTDHGGWYNSWGTKPKRVGAPLQPYLRILFDCEQHHKRQCYLYAVDNDVVYRSGGTMK